MPLVRIHSLPGLLAAALLSLPVNAQAKRQYPPVIQDTYQLGYVPPCSVCHVKGNTGPGTATTPFAYALRARGLTGSDRNSLPPALLQLEADGTDSDGDGISDYQELVDGTDPNTRANESIVQSSDPAFGCALRRGPANSLAGLGLLAALALGAAFRRLRVSSPNACSDD